MNNFNSDSHRMLIRPKGPYTSYLFIEVLSGPASAILKPLDVFESSSKLTSTCLILDYCFRVAGYIIVFDGAESHILFSIGTKNRCRACTFGKFSVPSK
jgi:hypothetical protein